MKIKQSWIYTAIAWCWLTSMLVLAFTGLYKADVDLTPLQKLFSYHGVMAVIPTVVGIGLYHLYISLAREARKNGN